MNEEQIRKKYETLCKSIGYDTSDLLELTAYFSALLSYVKNKMTENEASWAISKFIYPLMDKIDMIVRQKNTPEELWNDIYGADCLDLRIKGKEPEFGNLKAIAEDYRNAVHVFGEVKCRYVNCADYCVQIDEEIKKNLEMISL